MIEIKKCRCSCGHAEFEVHSEALFRVICHCTICQKFNAAAHADILVFKSLQVSSLTEGSVNFDTYKRPPNVQRGQCSECQQAVIEVFNFPLMPKLTMVPFAMFVDSTSLTEPCAHMFYEKRVLDVDDELPKYKGFISSQLAFFKQLWF